MLVWPTVALLGFLALAALVISLGTSSTARYEFERNRVQGQRQPAATPTPAAVPVAAVAAAPAVTVAAEAPGRVEHLATVPDAVREPAAMASMAAHPAGTRVAERELAPAWWLVDEGDDEPERVVAGPFADRIEASWAALSSSPEAPQRAVYGVPRPDGGVIRRQSTDEQAWLKELGDQLDRLPEDWDEQLSDDEADDDALVTLVVEVAAALVEAGLTVHDCAGHGSAGGVCLTPEPGRGGVLVSWHQHERMSRDQVRGAATDAAVQWTMNAAVADCLRAMGFTVEAFGETGCSLVLAAERWW